MMQSVQVIIERLKSHPEDFFGDLDSDKRTFQGTFPKFQRMTEKLDDLLTEKDSGHIHRLWFLEPDEKAALIEAYKEARRARFEANVFHTLLTEPENVPVSTVTQRYHPTTNKSLMQGSSIVTPQKIMTDSLAILEKEYAKNSNPRS